MKNYLPDTMRIMFQFEFILIQFESANKVLENTLLQMCTNLNFIKAFDKLERFFNYVK